MKAAIYTRVSTDNQAEVEFNSCETQETKIRSFIDSQENLKVHKVYKDEGYTGANVDRPALQQMLADIQRGRINSVITYKIDRLTRSPRDFYQLIDVFEKFNVSFTSITEKFDTSTPSGRLFRNIMLTFAQFERELTSERVKDKMFERAKKGFWNGGHTPLGYKRENKKLVIEPNEANIINVIYRSFVSTASIGRVYQTLKSRKLFGRNNMPLTKSTIAGILRNGVVYLGKTKYKDTIYDGIHEPIVSENMYARAQEIRKYRVKKTRVFNNSLFPGLIHCKECGSTMTSVFTNKIKNDNRIRYFYYRCSRIQKRDCSFCSIKQVSTDRLDKFIINSMYNMSKNEQYLDSFIFKLNHDNRATRNGLEPKGDQSPYTIENLRKILENIVNATLLPGKFEKREIIKRHIEKIIYSKETVEVKILYSESENSAFALQASAEKAGSTDNERAACFRPKPSTSRRSLEMVRYNNLAPRVGLEPTTT